jgi:hypothetical protein
MANPTLRFKDLVTAAGLERVNKAFSSSPEELAALQGSAAQALSRKPDLASTEVGRTQEGGFYDYVHDQLALSTGDPEVFRHEVEHAIRLKGASEAYKKLLSLTKRITRLNNFASAPAALALTKLVDDQEKRRQILRGLALVSAGLAVPNLLEEGAASLQAIKHSPSKINTTISMLPGFLSHSVHDLAAPGVYLGFSELGK